MYKMPGIWVVGLLVVALGAAAAPEPLPAVLLRGWPLRLTCEHRENPLGVGAEQPRLSWWVGDYAPGAVQSAYEIAVASTPEKLASAPDIWDSGKVASDQSVDVPYGGPRLHSEQRCYWKVRTWNAAGKPSDWSNINSWEMGLLAPADWHAKWIAAPARDTAKSAPAAYFRKEFVVDGHISRVTLYVSARGVYEMRLDGVRIGRDRMAPGWTDYRKRNQYLAYDLTGRVTGGLNVLSAILGDGWHNGYLKLEAGMRKNWYGEDTSLIAQLVVEYKDGKREVIGTDDSWSFNTGPILESDLYNGEVYDSRLELDPGGPTWDAPGYNGTRWAKARVVPGPDAPLVAKVNYPIRPQEVLDAKSVVLGPNYEWIYDFGQNISGVAKVKLTGRAGHTFVLRYAERLDPKGGLYTANLRDAKATDRYTFDESGGAVWEPEFTTHGFRYVGLSGVDERPALDAVQAVVIHNDAPRTGYFQTSDPLLNRLQSNIQWSQRDNAADVPTDCPQRDERLGWTGDASLYLPTGTFNYDESLMFEKWMADLRDAQTADGRFTVYAPAPDDAGDAAAYSDAGVICPWTIFERYGDRKILAENYRAMLAWIEYQRKTSEGLIRPATGYGDWLAPVIPGQPAQPTARDLIGTAYFAYTTELTRRTAQVLGNTQDAQRLAALHHDVVAAFQRKYVGADGRLSNDTQAAYALALTFDLLPESATAAAVRHLADDIRAHGWKVSTGFVGTPALMRVLKRYRMDDVGYHMVMQREYPGWLYMVDQGATTIWERWNSWHPQTGSGDKFSDTAFGDVKMNSFNHTVWGCVGEWMYAVIGGIDLDASAPGFKRIVIRPRPGGGLTWAKAALDSPYGRIATHWTLADRTFSLQVSIPPNTRAVVDLPDGKVTEVGAGDHSFEAVLAQP